MLYVKYHKNPIHGTSYNNVSLVFGNFGLKVTENAQLTEKHIVLIKKLFSTIFKKSSKLWLRLSVTYPKTGRALGSRMGSGKGPIEQKIAFVKKGQIFLEWSTFSADLNVIFIKKLFSKLGPSCVLTVKGL